MFTEQIVFSLNILGFDPTLFMPAVMLAMILIRISIVSKKKLLTSGDVELNPGPLTYKKTNLCSASPLSILEARLHQFGLKHRNVGGAGDCFFRAVSHQLYGRQTVIEIFVLLGYSS